MAEDGLNSTDPGNYRIPRPMRTSPSWQKIRTSLLRSLGDDCCSRRGRGSNASYEASSREFFAPIDDKTILTALCLIRLFLERREPRIGPVVE
jgi:hypothetical protein